MKNIKLDMYWKNFIKYEDLLEFSENTNFIIKLREVSDPIINKEIKQSILNALIDLRRLQKYHYDFFNKIFQNIFYHIPHLLNSSELDIILESMSLLKELFVAHPYYYEDIGEWIKELLPHLLQIYYTKKDHSQLAKEIILNIVHNIIYAETLESFLEELRNCQDGESAKSTFDFLIQAIENFDQVNLEHNIYWDSLIELITDIYNLKGEKGKFAKKIINLIRDKIGRYQFKGICEKFLSEELKDLMICIMSEIDS